MVLPIMLKAKLFAIVFVISAACAAPAMAQMVIDFDQAMQMAKENNRQLKLLKADSEFARLQVKEAYSGAYPVVNAVGSYSRNILIPKLEQDFEMNGEKASFKMELGRDNNYYGSVTLDQPLWIAGKIGLAIKIAKIYQDLAETGVAKGEKDLRFQVTQAFYGVIVTNEFKNLTVKTEEQIKSHLKNAQAMFDQGVVSEYDLLRAEVELANFHPTVTASEEASKMAREGLRILLGLEPAQEFTLKGELSEITPDQIDLEDAVIFAEQNRIDYMQLGLQKKMYTQLLKIEQRSQYWPSFFLSMAYTRQAQETDQTLYDNYFWSEGLSAGVSVTVPLFDGFKTRSRVQMAKVNLKKNDLMTMQAKDGIRLEIKSAFSKLYEAQDKLHASRKAAAQADKGYAIAEVRYQEGLSTQVELLDARLAQTQAQTSLLSAKFDLIVANAELKKAMGF